MAAQECHTSDLEIRVFKCDLFFNETLHAMQELIKITSVTLSRLDRLSILTNERTRKLDNPADAFLAPSVVQNSKD